MRRLVRWLAEKLIGRGRDVGEAIALLDEKTQEGDRELKKLSNEVRKFGLRRRSASLGEIADEALAVLRKKDEEDDS